MKKIMFIMIMILAVAGIALAQTTFKAKSGQDNIHDSIDKVMLTRTETLSGVVTGTRVMDTTLAELKQEKARLEDNIAKWTAKLSSDQASLTEIEKQIADATTEAEKVPLKPEK